MLLIFSLKSIRFIIIIYKFTIPMINNNLRNFLDIPYDDLETMNLEAKQLRLKGTDEKLFEEKYRTYLKKERRIKAVTLCFSDIEGRFHMIDYDKKYFLTNTNNLTFDGSSIRGFTKLSESDLRLMPEWSTLRWLPSDVFGPGKVIMFTSIHTVDKKPYLSDFRFLLADYVKKLKKDKNIRALMAPEIEGFVVEGVDAEQKFDENKGFKLISAGGYYHSLPQDVLRLFIDTSAEVQRAMGFENEKDHPEVAPSQFELNFKYGPVVEICDQIQLYKLVCRQVASNYNMTACFLPKPIAGINGSGMHINLSLWNNRENLFYERNKDYDLSSFTWDCINRILNHAPELCLIFNPSVNAYRRLDPHFEAPNQIKVSPTDRGSMIRIPAAVKDSTRIEIRSVAPDTNPYLTMYSILKCVTEGAKQKKDKDKRDRMRFLPGTLSDAMRIFKTSDFIERILGIENKEKFATLKMIVADRSPKELGTKVKNAEVLYHHEITNQILWNSF